MAAGITNFRFDDFRIRVLPISGEQGSIVLPLCRLAVTKPWFALLDTTSFREADLIAAAQNLTPI
jgi:hypothetical protein